MPRVAKDKARRTKKKSNKIEQENVNTNTKDDKFSFDEEIVIGLKRIYENILRKSKRRIIDLHRCIFIYSP